MFTTVFTLAVYFCSAFSALQIDSLTTVQADSQHDFGFHLGQISALSQTRSRGVMLNNDSPGFPDGSTCGLAGRCIGLRPIHGSIGLTSFQMHVLLQFADCTFGYWSTSFL